MVGEHHRGTGEWRRALTTPERVRQIAGLSAQTELEWGGLVRSRLVRPPDVPGPDGGLVDGEVHHMYCARYECLYLVRPDGYVGFRSQPAEKGPLREYLVRILNGG